MLDVRIEEQPLAPGTRDRDVLIEWLLRSLGLIRRQSRAAAIDSSQRPIARILNDVFLAEPNEGFDAKQLGDILGISTAGLHQHLARLRACRLISSSGEANDGWRAHHLRFGSIETALNLLSSELRKVLEHTLNDLEPLWDGGERKKSENLDEDIHFSLRIRDPSPFSDPQRPLTTWIRDHGLCGERPGRDGEVEMQVTKLMERIFGDKRPLAIDEVMDKYGVTRSRATRLLERLRACGLVSRRPLHERLPLALMLSISAQLTRRDEAWLLDSRRLGGFPNEKGKQILLRVKSGDTPEAIGVILDTVPRELALRTLGLIGGRIPWGHVPSGSTMKETCRVVLTRLDRFNARMMRVARRLNPS